MAAFLCNFSCPTEQLAEVTKRIQEIMPKFQPLPDYVTQRGPYWSSDIEKGYKCLIISEIDGSKIYQERIRIAAIFNSLNGIPGFKWSAELWVDQADAQERLEKYGI
jgi:hypothetical protein